MEYINFKILYSTENEAFIILTFPPRDEYLNEIVEYFKYLRKKYFKNLHYFLISWFYRDGIDQYNLLEKYSDSVTILANTPEEFIYFNFSKKKSIYCNQNAFLDDNLFVKQDFEKVYDIVINANNNIVKKHYLLKDLMNKYKILFITYHTKNISDRVDLQQYNPTDMISGIDPNTVCNLLNKCKIGIYLTYIDGACYASSEYLLCGLPIISTHSKGGRDIWYNDNNSIIINPNENELSNAIEYMLINYDKYNRDKIRNDHILKQNYFREKFIKYVQNLFTVCEINENYEEIFKKTFVNKMFDNADF